MSFVIKCFFPSLSILIRVTLCCSEKVHYSNGLINIYYAVSRRHCFCSCLNHHTHTYAYMHAHTRTGAHTPNQPTHPPTQTHLYTPAHTHAHTQTYPVKYPVKLGVTAEGQFWKCLTRQNVLSRTVSEGCPTLLRALVLHGRATWHHPKH